MKASSIYVKLLFEQIYIGFQNKGVSDKQYKGLNAELCRQDKIYLVYICHHQIRF